MKAKEYKKYLTRMSYEIEDLSQMEEFHEQTKFFPATVNIGVPRIISYMTEQRAMLETANNRKVYRYSPKIELPEAAETSATLKQCLRDRRTISRYQSRPVSLDELSGVLKDAVYPTCTMRLSNELDLHKRPYASGGGLYPVEIYPLLLNVDDSEAVQITHYNPFDHQLNVIQKIDRVKLFSCLNDIDDRLSRSGVIFILTAVLERSTIKYGKRGYRFALLEAGQLAQNISLCAVSRGLSSLPWGGYYDDRVAELLHIDNVNETVMHCLSIGESATN